MIFRADAHSIIEGEAQACESLPGKNGIGGVATVACGTDLDVIPRQDCAGDAESCAGVGGESIFFRDLQAQVEEHGHISNRAGGFSHGQACASHLVDVIGGDAGFDLGRQPVRQPVAAANPDSDAGIERDFAVGRDWLTKEFLQLYITGAGAANIALEVKPILFRLGRRCQWQKGQTQRDDFQFFPSRVVHNSFRSPVGRNGEGFVRKYIKGAWFCKFKEDFKLAFRSRERKTCSSNMEQNIAETHHLLNAWAWVEKNRKQVTIGVSAVAAVGLIVGYVSWSRAAREEQAGEALSQALFNGGGRTGAVDSGTQLLKVAADNSGTQSAAQALLLGAGALFSNGKYAEAQASFDQFARDNSSSPLVAQALYGSGAALAAQGKLAEAAQAYKNVVDRYPTSPVANQARYSQASVLATQGKLMEAVALYEEVLRNSAGSSLGNEAALRAEELHARLPAPAPIPAVVPATTTNAAPVKN